MFRNAIPLFRILGFEIRVDPSWLLIAALIVWSLSSQYFPASLPGRDSGVYFGLGVLAMFGLFGSLLLHELSHSLVARRFGLKVGGITLFIFGGVAELTEEPHDARSEFQIAIAGPLASFALAFLFNLLAAAFAGEAGSPAALAFFSYLGFINLVLAIFNLVPAFPMDGGRVLRAALWWRSGDLQAATRTSSRLGTLFGVFLMVYGLMRVFSGGGIGALWMILIGFFVFNASTSSYQSLRLKTVMKDHRIGELMTTDPVCADPDMPLDRLVHDVMLARNVSFLPVVANGVLLGYVDHRQVNGVARGDWPRTTVHDVMVPVDDANTLSPDRPTAEVVEILNRTGRRKYLVADGRRLLGVVSLSDLLAYFALRNSLGG
ncbi:MAG: site-2 protease family protein [Paracoccaceae bacterium]